MEPTSRTRNFLDFELPNIGGFRVQSETNMLEDLKIRTQIALKIGSEEFQNLKQSINAARTRMYKKAEEAIYAGYPPENPTKEQTKEVEDWIAVNLPMENAAYLEDQYQLSRIYFIFEFPLVCLCVPEGFDKNLENHTDSDLVEKLYVAFYEAREAIRVKKKSSTASSTPDLKTE